ncbi:MAG: hypothetical protein KF729_39170, partial [Sandaracinaceae bacterium]|nr:hypothetical protein [Sandaracinaceae bacterium]
VYFWDSDTTERETDDVDAVHEHYHLGTRLGSVTLEVDGSGALLAYEEYFPYGRTAFLAGDAVIRIQFRTRRFVGKEQDDATGFYAFQYRYYAPFIGNWVSPDPAGEVDGPNRYWYARNNPVTLVDELGLWSIGGSLETPFGSVSWGVSPAGVSVQAEAGGASLAGQAGPEGVRVQAQTGAGAVDAQAGAEGARVEARAPQGSAHLAVDSGSVEGSVQTPEVRARVRISRREGVEAAVERPQGGASPAASGVQPSAERPLLVGPQEGESERSPESESRSRGGRPQAAPLPPPTPQPEPSTAPDAGPPAAQQAEAPAPATARVQPDPQPNDPAASRTTSVGVVDRQGRIQSGEIPRFNDRELDRLALDIVAENNANNAAHHATGRALLTGLTGGLSETIVGLPEAYSSIREQVRRGDVFGLARRAVALRPDPGGTLVDTAVGLASAFMPWASSIAHEWFRTSRGGLDISRLGESRADTPEGRAQQDAERGRTESAPAQVLAQSAGGAALGAFVPPQGPALPTPTATPRGGGLRPRARRAGGGRRGPILADTDVIIHAMDRGHAGALAEIRAGVTYITPNTYRELLNVNRTGQRSRIRQWLRVEGIRVYGGPRAGRVAGTPDFQTVFRGTRRAGHSRADATLGAFARATGIEAVTLEGRLWRYYHLTRSAWGVPIRRLIR